MFSFFKKKFFVNAPIDGQLISLSKVGDPVFSKKVMGDGFAIIPQKDEGLITSPIDGNVEMVAETSHAIGLKCSNGTEILIHVGLDTVNLNGKGFTKFVTSGQKIKVGDQLLKFDPTFMAEKKMDMTTIVIFTNGYIPNIDKGMYGKDITRDTQIIG